MKKSYDFDPKKLGEVEVGWWKLHDELEFEPNKIELVDLFAKLYSEIFSIDEKMLKNAGLLRAWAT